MSEPQQGSSRRWARLRWGFPIAVAVLGMLAFLPGLHGEFLDWDDGRFSSVPGDDERIPLPG